MLHVSSWTPGKQPTAAPGRPDALTWRKSARSGANGNECVEVACDGQYVLVRDSKNKTGGTLTCLPQDWGAFLDKIKAGKSSPGRWSAGPTTALAARVTGRSSAASVRAAGRRHGHRLGGGQRDHLPGCRPGRVRRLPGRDRHDPTHGLVLSVAGGMP